MKKINNTSLVLIGTVPLLGATGRIYYAFWTAVCFLGVLLLSSLSAYLIGKLITGRIRLLAYTAVTGGLTASAAMLLQAYVPAAETNIGVCLSFLVANCLILQLCESSAENGFKAVVVNSAVCGISGAAILIAAAAVRELLRYGTLFSKFGGGEGVSIFSDWFANVEFAGTSAGALIIFGLIAASARKISSMIHVSRRNHMLRQERIVSGRHPDLVIDKATGKIVRRSTAEVLEQRRHASETDAENALVKINANAENAAEFAANDENDSGEVSE